MITEDYCSYEVAKLLKEKGFLKGVDLRITQNLSFYDNIGLRHNLDRWYDSLIQDKIDFIVAPTLQMAMKWLREVHKLYVDIRFNNYYLEYKYIVFSMEKDGDVDFHTEFGFSSYERTVEAAIKYCLENLI